MMLFQQNFLLEPISNFLHLFQAVNHSPNGEERRHHVTRVVIIVVLVFAICWGPLHIQLLVAYYGHIPENPIYYAMLIIWYCLAFGNSVLNPIIYNFFSSDFRRSFRQVMCCQAESPPVSDV